MGIKNGGLHVRELKKPDGRSLWLYGTDEKALGRIESAPSPFPDKLDAKPELRFHPLRGEWITYADHRQNRTFLPPPDFNPLAVTKPGGHQTEVPEGDYAVAVFENRFPSLVPQMTPNPARPGAEPGLGACEVIVYSQDPTASMARIPVEQVDHIIEVWGARARFLTEKRGLRALLPFENRGVECGVTLHHPHGQIYAYSWLPKLFEEQWQAQADHLRAHGKGLIESLIASLGGPERERLVYENATAAAWVPGFARYPYEAWVAPKRRVAAVHELSAVERRDLAQALQTLIKKYDGLWQRPFPYVMALYLGDHSGEIDGTHLHFEFFPPYRTKDKLKYLAGTEVGAQVFANDKLPEVSAQELREVRV